jgi:hypothetical protein
MRYILFCLAFVGCATDDYTLCEKACDVEHTSGRPLQTCLTYCDRCIVGNDPECDQ